VLAFVKAEENVQILRILHKKYTRAKPCYGIYSLLKSSYKEFVPNICALTFLRFFVCEEVKLLMK
jgi:hypothetical protein